MAYDRGGYTTTEMGRDAAHDLMVDAGYYDYDEEDLVEWERQGQPATPSESVQEWRVNAATEDPATCPCKGSGWMLHDYDVWVKCLVHHTDQPHPEDEEAVAAYPDRQEAERREIATLARVDSLEARILSEEV